MTIEDNNEKRKDAKILMIPATIIEISVLSMSPPTIECVIDGVIPRFTTYLVKCDTCQKEKPRFFNSLDLMKKVIREIPLGCHFAAQYGTGKDLESS